MNTFLLTQVVGTQYPKFGAIERGDLDEPDATDEEDKDDDEDEEEEEVEAAEQLELEEEEADLKPHRKTSNQQVSHYHSLTQPLTFHTAPL